MSEMLEQLDAIPRTLGGVTFRSTLEARWSLFFSALGLVWIYEPGLYRVHGVGYMPDFWLLQAGPFIEVKPAGHEPDHGRYQEFVQMIQRPLVLLLGPPRLGDYEAVLYRPDVPPEEEMAFALGRREEFVEVWLASLASGVAVCMADRSTRGNWPTHSSERLKAAYRAACSYRFEGGG